MSDRTPGRLALNPEWGTLDDAATGRAVPLSPFAEGGPENARRLVACWNALAGVSTTDLEAVAEPTSSLLRLSLLSAIVREAALREARAAGAAEMAAAWEPRPSLDDLKQAGWDEATAEPLGYITTDEATA